MVGVEFDCPAHGEAATIWHRVMRVSEPWPVPTVATREAAMAPQEPGNRHESDEQDGGGGE